MSQSCIMQRKGRASIGVPRETRSRGLSESAHEAETEGKPPVAEEGSCYLAGRGIIARSPRSRHCPSTSRRRTWALPLPIPSSSNHSRSLGVACALPIEVEGWPVDVMLLQKGAECPSDPRSPFGAIYFAS